MVPLPSRHEAVVSGLLSPICLPLLSLLGWFCTLLKVPRKLAGCARLSLEFCADTFFCWVQRLLLASLLLLLLAWKTSQRAQRCAQRKLQQSWVRLLHRSLVALIVWGPTYCITRVTALLAWVLQAAFEHTTRVAGREEEEEAMEMVVMKTERGGRPLPLEEPCFLGKEAKVEVSACSL
uniref:Uncharacterized protein n=1 Tax=Pelusios castaneus TaxID=367368 RepID=A0A8C8RH96_9SAUR